MVLDFVKQLYTTGRVRLPSSEPSSLAELHAALQWLGESESNWREHLPRLPPPLEKEALQWSVQNLYRAAQLAVFRHLGPHEVERLKENPSPDRQSPSAVYSVDLVFRFLPDLTRIVAGMNAEDPLVEILRDWACRWPLSSVGMPEVREIDIEPILHDACLRGVYADRILETEDTSRLSDPRVLELIRGVLGAYPELSPGVSEYLQSQSPTDTVDINRTA